MVALIQSTLLLVLTTALASGQLWMNYYNGLKTSSPRSPSSSTLDDVQKIIDFMKSAESTEVDKRGKSPDDSVLSKRDYEYEDEEESQIFEVYEQFTKKPKVRVQYPVDRNDDEFVDYFNDQITKLRPKGWPDKSVNKETHNTEKTASKQSQRSRLPNNYYATTANTRPASRDKTRFQVDVENIRNHKTSIKDVLEETETEPPFVPIRGNPPPPRNSRPPPPRRPQIPREMLQKMKNKKFDSFEPDFHNRPKPKPIRNPNQRFPQNKNAPIDADALQHYIDMYRKNPQLRGLLKELPVDPNVVQDYLERLATSADGEIDMVGLTNAYNELVARRDFIPAQSRSGTALTGIATIVAAAAVVLGFSLAQQKGIANKSLPQMPGLPNLDDIQSKVNKLLKREKRDESGIRRRGKARRNKQSRDTSEPSIRPYAVR